MIPAIIRFGGNTMEVFLVMAMFICCALALNFLTNGKHKLSGMFMIINLCLIVATAYQFKLIDSIIIVLIVLAVLVVGTLLLGKKRKQHRVIDARISNKGEK